MDTRETLLALAQAVNSFVQKEQWQYAGENRKAAYLELLPVAASSVIRDINTHHDSQDILFDVRVLLSEIYNRNKRLFTSGEKLDWEQCEIADSLINCTAAALTKLNELQGLDATSYYHSHSGWYKP